MFLLHIAGAALVAVSTPTQSSPARIAYATKLSGHWEIVITDEAGRERTPLTVPGGDCRFPVWSPDGTRMIFGLLGDASWELWSMDATGRNPLRLADGVIAKARRTWSPDGSDLTRLTNTSADERDASWSPDGTRIAFASSRDGQAEIYVMRADGSDPVRLTRDAGRDESPAWSPDGARLAFSSTRDDGRRRIHLMNVDGSHVTRLTMGDSDDDLPAWSHDGAWIAFQAVRDKNYDVDVVRVADGERRPLVNTPGYDGQFAWSSGGPKLALVSGDIKSEALYVVDVVSGSRTRVAPEPVLDPNWAP
jgi:Tol biopolymer transport system component